MQSPSPEQLRQWSDEYKSGIISNANKAIFEAWLLEQPADNIVWEGTEEKQELRNEMLFNINKAIKPVLVRRLWIRYAAAASILIVFAVGAYLYNQSPGNKPVITELNDALPGREGAILTLADGRQLVLDSLHPGELKGDEGSSVLLNKGQLVYNSNNSSHPGLDPGSLKSQVVYNTLSTPKGRIYKLILSDGTAVWLNSSSSITYPLVFDKNSREVNITGEVYFEVAKDKRRRFIVDVGNVDVEVLGTHFNINAYSDENNINTTLLEGRVRVVQGDKKYLLKPGQQSRSDHNISKIMNADTEEVMAWKNGSFQFNDAGLGLVLKQLSRWYDVDVKYEGNIPHKKLVGEISRDSKLSEVLKALEYTGVKFRISGKTIIVTQ